MNATTDQPAVRYDLRAGTLDVTGPLDWAGAVFDGILMRHDGVAPLMPAMRLSLRRGSPETPAVDATLLHEGPGQGRETIAIYNKGPIQWMIRPGLASLRLDPATGLAELALDEDGELADSFDLSMHALDAAIAATRQVLVHAACLADLDNTAHGLVFAPSGTGKTTTTLALARAGHAMANDDTSVLSHDATGGGLSVWGLARDPNVHRRTVQMLPWLKGAANWSHHQERAVALDKLADLVPISPHVRRPVAAVFALARGTGSVAEARALPPAEALARLVSDNVRHSAFGLGARDLAALDCLTDLIRAVPAFELQVPEGAEGLASAARVFGDTLASAARR